MQNTFKLGLTAGAAVVALATAGVAPAQAFTITSTAGQFSTVGGATTVDFDAGLPASPVYTGGGLATGNVAGSAQPLGDGTHYLSLGGVGRPSPVTIDLTSLGLQNYFGLYWGSIDTYNTIEFFDGAASVGSFTGTQVAALATGLSTVASGSQVDATANRYINFFSGAGENFNRIVLTSTSPAFESDNHAFRAVPTPALLPGLVGLGVSFWRKRRQQAA
jgi:hypothetical protein